MLSQPMGRALRRIAAAALSLSACRTFSPDGGMETVAAVAGGGLNKDVVRVARRRRPRLRSAVTRLLHAPLSADAAVQIALLNNPGLQAAYNRLGIAEAVAVRRAGRPASASPSTEVATPVELDIERQIVGSLLVARDQAGAIQDRRRSEFEQAELRAAEETLRVAAETRRAYMRAVAAREIVAALGEAKASAEACRRARRQLKQTGAVNKLDHAGASVRSRDGRRLVAARQQADAAQRAADAAHGSVGDDLGHTPAKRAAPVADNRATRGAVEQEAMDPASTRVARLEIGRSRGPTASRARRISSTCSTPPASPRRRRTQASRGRRRRLRARVRGAALRFRQGAGARGEQRYLEALNTLGRRGSMRARKRARPMAPIAPPTRSPPVSATRCCRCSETISAETELQYNAMQVDAFALLEAARAKGEAKWQASRPSGISGSPRPISASPCSAAEALRRASPASLRLSSGAGPRPRLDKDNNHALATKISRRLGGGAGQRRRHRRPRQLRRRSPRRRPLSSPAMQPPIPPQGGQDYQPVVTLNGWTLPWRMNGGVEGVPSRRRAGGARDRARHDRQTVGL